jgi:hypothetical protein
MAVPDVTAEGVYNGADFRLIKWETLGNGEWGSPIKVEEFSDATVHIAGTFGASGSITIYGSNIAADLSVEPAESGATWVAVKDTDNAAVTETALALETIINAPMYLAPKVTAGDETTDLDVYIKLTRR